MFGLKKDSAMCRGGPVAMDGCPAVGEDRAAALGLQRKNVLVADLFGGIASA